MTHDLNELVALKDRANGNSMRKKMALFAQAAGIEMPTCPEDEWREMCDLTAQTADGLKLPPNWRRASAREGEPINYLRQDGLSVLVSAGRFDGRLWQH